MRHSKMDRMALADPSVYMALNARKTPPIMKHKSYFEIAENADRKAKKLETEVLKVQGTNRVSVILTCHRS